MMAAKNKRGTLWEDEEVDALIALWGDEDVQAKLESAARNIKVFALIAKRLQELGYEGRSTVQCREKIKKLKGAYRKSKSHNGKVGQHSRP